MNQQLSFLSKNVETLIKTDGEVVYHPGVFEQHQKLMEELIRELPWRQDEITLYGKTHPVPRLQLWMASDRSLSYTYSGIQMKPVTFHPLVQKIKTEIEVLSGHEFNSCLVNYYRDGNDYAAWHADNEKGLGSCIVSVSLGESRLFKLKHRTKDLKYQLELKGGDVLIMTEPLQQNWLHQLNKTKKPVEPRVNLTFRSLVL